MVLNCKSKNILLLVLLAIAIETGWSSEEESSIISRFQQYLKINTAQPTPRYHEAADFLISQGKALSLESQSIEFVAGKPLVLLKWEGSNPNLPSILLYSHTSSDLKLAHHV